MWDMLQQGGVVMYPLVYSAITHQGVRKVPCVAGFGRRPRPRRVQKLIRSPECAHGVLTGN